MTGGAGFIGYHVARTLQQRSLGDVLVVDDFNEYYDVRLKIVSTWLNCMLNILKCSVAYLKYGESAQTRFNRELCFVLQDRAYELHKLDIKVFNEDLCNEDFLDELFATYDITHVVHCAAQAGVRYSLKHPLEYVTANVQCFLSLLNAAKYANKVHD